MGLEWRHSFRDPLMFETPRDTWESSLQLVIQESSLVTKLPEDVRQKVFPRSLSVQGESKEIRESHGQPYDGYSKYFKDGTNISTAATFAHELEQITVQEQDGDSIRSVKLDIANNQIIRTVDGKTESVPANKDPATEQLRRQYEQIKQTRAFPSASGMLTDLIPKKIESNHQQAIKLQPEKGNSDR